MGNPTTIRSRFGGTTAQDAGGEDGADQMFDMYVAYTKAAADGMASTATANTMFWMNPYDFSLRIVAGSLAPTATLTASDTDYATITIKTDDGAASTPAAALTWESKVTGGTGNWAVGVKEAATVTAANATLVAGGCLWFNIAKAGSGVVVGISHYVARLRRV